MSSIVVDFVFKKSKDLGKRFRQNPQLFLEEFKFIENEIKRTRYITEDIEISFYDDDHESDSDPDSE